MNVYFSHCESDQLLAKAAKCRLLAATTPAEEAARFLSTLADDYEMKAHVIEGGHRDHDAAAGRS